MRSNQGRHTDRASGWWMMLLPLGMLGSGCVSSPTDPRQIAKRRGERAAAFAALTPDQQSQVNRGQVQVGMPEDGVYIAWGPPAQVLRRGDASGEETLWLYSGSTTDQYISWNYVEVPGPNGRVYLDRVMSTDYAFRDYVSARLVFRDGEVASWEMLPKPPSNTIYSPASGPVIGPVLR